MRMTLASTASGYSERDLLEEAADSLMLRTLPGAQGMLNANSFSLYRQRNEYKINGFIPGDGGILGRVEDVMEWGPITSESGFPRQHWKAFVKQTRND